MTTQTVKSGLAPAIEKVPPELWEMIAASTDKSSRDAAVQCSNLLYRAFAPHQFQEVTLSGSQKVLFGVLGRLIRTKNKEFSCTRYIGAATIELLPHPALPLITERGRGGYHWSRMRSCWPPRGPHKHSLQLPWRILHAISAMVNLKHLELSLDHFEGLQEHRFLYELQSLRRDPFSNVRHLRIPDSPLAAKRKTRNVQPGEPRTPFSLEVSRAISTLEALDIPFDEYDGEEDLDDRHNWHPGLKRLVIKTPFSPEAGVLAGFSKLKDIAQDHKKLEWLIIMEDADTPSTPVIGLGMRSLRRIALTMPRDQRMPEDQPDALEFFQATSTAGLSRRILMEMARQVPQLQRICLLNEWPEIEAFERGDPNAGIQDRVVVTRGIGKLRNGCWPLGLRE
ncbi:hypothetical protein QBC43DRAFT_367929 [Cladorrhinum sp. PSN259]|nr:hypothetical protein QBC43DRAFT_367929 [Cladorrhinum sp. PSN259]